MFHLFTHAFFKALLFLGAGSVLHALHHAMHREVQDVRLMGGLGPKMPITAITWLIATLSIGGFPFFAGFYSKDTIIGLAYEHGNYGLWVITLLTAGLTAFYMLRAYILAFGGKGGTFGGLWGGPYRGEHEERLQESPRTMTIPLILLAIPSVIAGYWFGFFSYIKPGAPGLNFLTIVSDWKTWLGVVVALVGFAWAYTLYTRFEFARINAYVQSHAVLRVLHRILLRKYYVDEFYQATVLRGSLVLSRIAYWFDQNIIDALVNFMGAAGRAVAYVDKFIDETFVDGAVNGIGNLTWNSGKALRRLQTGHIQSYLYGALGGAIVFVIIQYVIR